MDMWTGAHEKDMETHDRMSWARSGFTPNEVSLGGLSEGAKGVVFLTEECDRCNELIEGIRNKNIEVGIALIPPPDTTRASRTTRIWCKNDKPLDLALKWIQNSYIEGDAICEQAEGVGKIQAMADVFELHGPEPTYITTSGEISRGYEEINKAWRQE